MLIIEIAFNLQKTVGRVECFMVTDYLFSEGGIVVKFPTHTNVV